METEPLSQKSASNPLELLAQSLLSYFAGSCAAALTLGLLIAIKGTLQLGAGGILFTEVPALVAFVSLSAIPPILIFAMPGHLVLVVLYIFRGPQSLRAYAAVWAVDAVAVMTALMASGGHLVGPFAHQPFLMLALLAVAGSIGGGAAWSVGLAGGAASLDRKQ